MFACLANWIRYARAFAHLVNAARRRGQFRAVHYLDRIDHKQLRRVLTGCLQNLFDAGFGKQLEIVLGQLQPARAHTHLLRRFLSGNIKRLPALPGQQTHDLEQQCTFPGTGIAADEHHRARYEAAAEDPVEFGDAACKARQFGEIDIGELRHFAVCSGVILPARSTTALGRTGIELHQGVPGIAGAALTLPFGVVGAAVTAYEGDFRFGHGQRLQR